MKRRTTKKKTTKKNTILELLTPIEDLIMSLTNRAYYRGWFPPRVGGVDFIAKLVKKLGNKTNKTPSSLLGIDLWIGHGIQHNVFEAIEWLCYELNKIGIKVRFDSSLIGSLDNLNDHTCNVRRMKLVRVNFNKLTKSICGLPPQGVPALNCLNLWFIAANPKLVLLAQQPAFNNGIKVPICDPGSPGKVLLDIIFRYVDGTVHINGVPRETTE